MAATDTSQHFSAGILALLVHGVFFAVLFFGVSWHLKPQTTMTVEMWDHLPDLQPAVTAPPEPLILPPEEVLTPPKPAPLVESEAEITLKIKKKKEEKPPPKTEPTPAQKNPQQEAAQRQALLKQQAEQQERERIRAAELKAQREAERIQALKLKMRASDEKSAREAERLQARQAQMRAEMDAATRNEVSRYKDMIRAKIRRNIVMPDGVSEQAEAQFSVIVLPGGSVAEAKLVKSSGNSAYDSAVERAIYTAQPLPLPKDEGLARLFRELNLSVKPGQ
jgi:colicin import membrane protein